MGGISESFAQLDVVLPPLVEYDLLESDFVLESPAPVPVDITGDKG